jgi:hypothetical protein
VDIWEDLDTLRYFSAWGIPSPSYIKSWRLHITMVQTLLMGYNHLIQCLP